MHKVNVSVPAVMTHIGPGYDVLGLALNLRTTIDMSLIHSDDLVVEMRGEGEGVLSEDYHNPAVMAAISLFQHLEEAPAGLYVRCANAIPLDTGLSAQTAMIVGGLVGANNLLGSPLRHNDLIGLASHLSEQPTAAVAALRGGLSICTQGANGLIYQTIEPAPMRVTVALPAASGATPYRRSDPPEDVPLADAVYNIGHTALVIEALREGDFALLHDALGDRLHEPYRSRDIPAYDAVLRAAQEAGAVGVVVSGGGPCLVAFADQDHQQIADAMASVWRDKGIESWTRSLAVDMQGVVISVVQ